MIINWNSLTKEEIKRELLDIINNDKKFNKILVDQNGKSNRYTLNDEEFTKFAAVGVAATCFSEEEVKILVRSTFEANIDKISEWIERQGFALTLDSVFEHPIGKRSNGKTTIEQNSLRVTLRKAINDTTEYGFYISGIVPYMA